MRVFFSTIIMIVLAYNGTSAQSFGGAELDNYTGVAGVIFNPATIVDSRFKTDINILQVNSLIGSDYFGIDFSNLDGFSFEDDSNRFPRSANNFYTGVDVLLPSFQFNLAPKHSIAFTTRLRIVNNLDNVNGELVELLLESGSNGSIKDFTFNQDNFRNNLHAWGELGVSYGAVLLQNETHMLKGGVTLKYLSGGGTVSFNSSQLNGSYDTTSETVNLNGNVEIAETINDSSGNDDFNFFNGNSGLGLDLGFVYEYRPQLNDNKMDEDVLKGHNKYKFKLGLSITDVGSITYRDVQLDRYALNGSVSVSELENDLEQAIEDNFVSTSAVEDISKKLPALIRYSVDYRINRNLYVGSTGAFSLMDSVDPFNNRQLNYFTISPRYESKLFTIYSNLSSVEHLGLNWGAGFRLGPVTIGSNTIFTNLISNNSLGLDVYAGLKIPIHQRITSKNKTR